MKSIRDLFLPLMLLLFVASCSSFNSILYSKEIEHAKQLANGGEYVVTESSLEQMRTGGPKVTSACDLSITVSKISGAGEKSSFCIYKDHTRFSEYASLRSGDHVQFEFIDTVLQNGGSGPSVVSFLIVNRLYK